MRKIYTWRPYDPHISRTKTPAEITVEWRCIPQGPSPWRTGPRRFLVAMKRYCLVDALSYDNSPAGPRPIKAAGLEPKFYGVAHDA